MPFLLFLLSIFSTVSNIPIKQNNNEIRKSLNAILPEINSYKKLQDILNGKKGTKIAKLDKISSTYFNNIFKYIKHNINIDKRTDINENDKNTNIRENDIKNTHFWSISRLFEWPNSVSTYAVYKIPTFQEKLKIVEMEPNDTTDEEPLKYIGTMEKFWFNLYNFSSKVNICCIIIVAWYILGIVLVINALRYIFFLNDFFNLDDDEDDSDDEKEIF